MSRESAPGEPSGWSRSDEQDETGAEDKYRHTSNCDRRGDPARRVGGGHSVPAKDNCPSNYCPEGGCHDHEFAHPANRRSPEPEKDRQGERCSQQGSTQSSESSPLWHIRGVSTAHQSATLNVT